MKTYLTCAETAKLLRKSLATHFPNQKFGVRSHTYSGGASIRVSWIDGPSVAAVETICQPFEGASFDGMIDLKSYHDSIHPETGESVHFGADYIFEERSYSAEALQTIIDEQTGLWAMAGPEIIIEETGNIWMRGGEEPIRGGMHYQTIRREIERELKERTFHND